MCLGRVKVDIYLIFYDLYILTEFIIFGTCNIKKLRKSFPVNILDYFISPTEAIRNLGVWFDSHFSFFSQNPEYPEYL